MYLAEPATCTKPATYYVSCDCGDHNEEVFEDGDPLGHDFTEQRIAKEYLAKEATEYERAKYYYSCSRCSEMTLEKTFEYGSLAPHIHDFSIKNVNEKYLKEEKSCTEAAKYYYSCRCGETNGTYFTYGEPRGHIFDQMVVTDPYIKKSPSCTEPGEFYFSCICGEKGQETFLAVAPQGHFYSKEVISEDRIRTEATHDESATYYYTCQYCDSVSPDSYFTYGDPIGHVFNVKIRNQNTLLSQGNCSTPSVYYYSCECGEVSTTETFEIIDGDHELQASPFQIDYANHEHGNIYQIRCIACGYDTGDIYDDGQYTCVYDRKVVDEKYLAFGGTCSDSKQYYYSCECGRASPDRTFESGEYNYDIHNHIAGISEEGTYYEYIDDNYHNFVSYSNCLCGGCGSAFLEEDRLKQGHYKEENLDDIYFAYEKNGVTYYYYSCPCGYVFDEVFY